MKTWLWLTVAAVAAALLAGCGGREPVASETDTAQVVLGIGGKIAYSSSRAGDFDIYIQTFGTSGTVRRVAQSTALDTSPCWSRDRTKLVFVSNRSGQEQIYTVKADGTGLLRVTFSSSSDREPCWNNDGTRIAFTRGTDAMRAIWTMRSDGSDLRRLTPAKGFALQPSWSPNGATIVFSRANPIAANPDIARINANDGSGLVRLTNDPAPDRNPEYSWDGQWIAFDSTRGNISANSSIWRMKADGTGEVRVTTGTPDQQPTWSPDGRRIAFVRTIAAGSQLFSTTRIGTVPVQITNSARFNVQPSWAAIP